VDAERDIHRAAGILYMQQRVGETFEGTVTGVQRYGFYVELDEIFVEGFVPIGRLHEYYEFVPERMELHSRISNDVIRTGRTMHIRVRSAELAERRLEFEPIGRQ
jgi:ribonuclease R